MFSNYNINYQQQKYIVKEEKNNNDNNIDVCPQALNEDNFISRERGHNITFRVEKYSQVS